MGSSALSAPTACLSLFFFSSCVIWRLFHLRMRPLTSSSHMRSHRWRKFRSCGGSSSNSGKLLTISAPLGLSTFLFWEISVSEAAEEEEEVCVRVVADRDLGVLCALTGPDEEVSEEVLACAEPSGRFLNCRKKVPGSALMVFSVRETKRMRIARAKAYYAEKLKLSSQFFCAHTWFCGFVLIIGLPGWRKVFLNELQLQFLHR